MELIFEQIRVPEKRSFITRRLDLALRSPKIHSHKNFELNLITSGSGRRLVGDHIAAFEKNDLVLMGPNLPHCWDVQQCIGDEKPECIVIHFYEDLIGSALFNTPELKEIRNLLQESSNGIHFHQNVAEQVRPLMKLLAGERGLTSYIQLLQIFQLLLSTSEKDALAATPYTKTYQNDHDRINKVYQYVLENLHAEISQEKAAALLHMAPGSFCRYFRKKTDSTFSAYVKKVRISLAAKMLIESEMRISQISYECGYNSISNFNHHFRALFSKSPSDYRRQFEEISL